MPDFTFDREAVRAAMKQHRVTAEALADAVGLTHASAVYKLLSGDRRVKVEEARAIYEHLGIVEVEQHPIRSIPVIGLAAAGQWREAVEMPLGRIAIPYNVAGPRAFAVEVAGDSMNKLIPDGGWIVVDPDDIVLAPGKVYLLQNGEMGTTVKRYQKMPSRFEPVSDNPEHREFLVSEVDFVIVGRVVWKGETL